MLPALPEYQDFEGMRSTRYEFVGHYKSLECLTVPEML